MQPLAIRDDGRQLRALFDTTVLTPIDARTEYSFGRRREDDASTALTVDNDNETFSEDDEEATDTEDNDNETTEIT